MNNKNPMHFRVYRREKGNVIFCWNNERLTEDQRSSVGIFVKDEDTWKNAIYHPATAEQYPNVGSNKDITIIVIKEGENLLDPKKSYDFVLRLGKKEPVEGYKTVFPEDDLREVGDNKKQEVFLRLWDPKAKVWRKAEGGYDEEGQFCLLVKVVANSEPKP